VSPKNSARRNTVSDISYRIIADHTDAPGLYLVSAEAAGSFDVLEDIPETAMVQVLDTRQGILFPPTPLSTHY